MSMRLYTALILLGLGADALNGQPSTATAFRDYTRGVGERVVLAAEAMPAELYSFKPTPSQSTFAELLSRIEAKTYHFCSRLSGAIPQRSSSDVGSESKAALTLRVRDSFSWCNQVLAVLNDSRLSDTVVIDMREAFPFAPRARTAATAMTLSVAYWVDIYGQLAQYLRLNGRIPPAPCGRDGDDTTSCDSGLHICRPTRAGGAQVSQFVLSDAPYSVRSDGRGAYIRGQDGAAVAAGNALVMFWPIPPRSTANPRTITIDLNQPISGGGGVPLGIVRSHAVEIMAQWYKEPNQAQHSVLEIPVGSEVKADQANVVFNIDGVRHALQMGPQPLGHCFSDGSTMTGDGTSPAIIRRPSETQWVVELPPGSVGRLFDIHLGEPNAVDRGLYHVSLKFVIQP